MEIQIKQNVSLKDLCTYRTGGKAMFLAETKDWKGMLGLREFAKQKNIPYMILGGGSNILFPDEGFPGLVILNKMGKVTIHGQMATAESGVNIMQLLLLTSEHNLGGISGLANVPGTVGGAVYGNAGIPDLWIGNLLMSATILPKGSNKPTLVPNEYFEFGYRTSKIKKTGDIILSATIKLNPTPKNIIKKEINDYIKARALKQPAGHSCGSFFKNPDHFPSAGWLIDQSGCKGMKEGGAQVSEKHANFIMNTGEATSTDVLNLARKVHKKVKDKFNIHMEPEVQILPVNPFKK